MIDTALFDAAASLAMALAAGAAWVLPGRAPVRRPRSAARRVTGLLPRRAVFPAAGTAAALLLIGAPWWLMMLAAPAAGYAGLRVARRDRPLSLAEMRSLAATFDIFAACLDSGLATTAALAASIAEPGGAAGPSDRARAGRGPEALAQTSALLQLGGQPSEAWRPVARIPALAGLAAAAARSAAGGLKLADAARETSRSLRGTCRATVTDRAARAGVAMTAPLAVCFLPAFLCLGLAPTIIGMVSSVRLW